MAQAICQQMLRVAESFVGLSAQVGGTRSHVSRQGSSRWAPGDGSPGLALCCFLLNWWSCFSLPNPRPSSLEPPLW